MERDINRPARACPLCQSTGAQLWATAFDIEYFTSADPHAYWHCPACHSLYLDPLPAGDLSAIYPANYYSYGAGGSTLSRIKTWLDARRLRGWLRQVSSPTLRVLDIGGGSGFNLDIARQADARVMESWVVDIDAGAKVLAEGKGHHFFLGPFEAYQDAGKFDIIFALNVIEHVADPAAFLRHCRTLLAPGGRLLIQTPNFDSLDARLFRHKSWAGLHCPRHWVLFSETSLRNSAAQADLDVNALTFTQGAPFWGKSVLACLWRKGLVRIDSNRPADTHPLLPLLLAGFAALDFLRRPFARTSQMIVTLAAASSGASSSRN